MTSDTRRPHAGDQHRADARRAVSVADALRAPSAKPRRPQADASDHARARSGASPRG